MTHSSQPVLASAAPVLLTLSLWAWASADVAPASIRIPDDVPEEAVPDSVRRVLDLDLVSARRSPRRRLVRGRLLADRALSRLLKQDWPKRLEDLEGATGGS